MAGVAVMNRPPLDLFKRFSCEKNGVHKGKFNIKLKGLSPIIDAARLFALEKRVYQTSTIERLSALRESSSLGGTLSGELEQAFEFLMSLRLKHQYEQIQAGKEPDNFIDPCSLGSLDRTLLKESFKLIGTVQDTAIRSYSPWSVM